jgi:pimeloyl-ACP methyl ester carboxylesterase
MPQRPGPPRAPISRRALVTSLAAGGVLSGAGLARAAESGLPLRAEVGAQKPVKRLQLDGVSIAYHDSGGTGQVLICLHAIGHGARDFEDLGRRLAPYHRVIAIDWPGQGASGPDSQAACGLRYTQLLELFVDRLRLRSFVLLGNSIGGAAAVRYAGRHPERVTRLVLCDPGGIGPVPDPLVAGYIEKQAAFFETGARGDPAFAPAFRAYYEKVLIAPGALAERERIVRSAYEIAPVLAQAWHSFARPEESLWDVAPTLRSPVLFAWSKDDQIIPLGASRRAIERFPDHQLEVLQGGHAAFLEDPDAFEYALRQFLEPDPPVG